MTYTVQPSQQPTPSTTIRINGDASHAVIWVGVVLLALAATLVVRRRPKGK